jgi:hypothetical protein
VENKQLFCAVFDGQDGIDGAELNGNKRWPAFRNLVRALADHVIICHGRKLDASVATASEEVHLLEGGVPISCVNHVEDF